MSTILSWQCPRARIRGWVRRSLLRRRASAGDEPSKQSGTPVNEDVLAKLRQFEEENKKLKEKLESQEPPASANTREKKKPYVDAGGMRREGFFGSSGKGTWLSESDVEFFTGGKSGEQSVMEASETEKAIVGRRLAIAAVLTVVTVAFALVPTERLDGSASKPTYFYLVPVLRSIVLRQIYLLRLYHFPMAEALRNDVFARLLERLATLLLTTACLMVITTAALAPNQQRLNKIAHLRFGTTFCLQSLLDDLAVEIEAGNLDSIALVVNRVLDKPNKARSNMYTAIEALDSRSQQPAREIVGNFVDYVQQADYNKYYASIGEAKDGRSQAEFQNFSLKSVQAASREGRAYLALFPPSDVAAAKEALRLPS